MAPVQIARAQQRPNGRTTHRSVQHPDRPDHLNSEIIALAQPLKRLGAAAAVPAEAEVMADDDVFDAYGPNQILLNELLRAEARKGARKTLEHHPLHPLLGEGV